MAAALRQAEELSRGRPGRLFRPRYRARQNPHLPAAVPHRARAEAGREGVIPSPSRRHVGDDRQMIGARARAAVDVAADQRLAGPAIDPVEAEKWQARRKRPVTRIAGKLARERGAHGTWPEPVVEVADDHRRHAALAGDVEQRPRLGAPLADAQAEMGGDDADRADRSCNLRLDGAARLALGKRDVMDLVDADRPTADQHLAVVAVG